MKHLAIDDDIWDDLEFFPGLTRFKSLVELTFVLHDETMMLTGQEHESWRMQPTQFELVTLKARDCTEDCNDWRQSVIKSFARLKADYPEWHEPELSFKTVVRGGRQCCFAI